ncbi:MAG: hypothetical protein FJ135_05685 [Deltaproteobacteria bacterium]|nr:hypothetical protein [Deltaproteobacteria bacterium]
MSVEKAGELTKCYAKEIGIARSRYKRILTVVFTSGLFRVRDATGEILFSHEVPEEIGKFLCQLAG